MQQVYLHIASSSGTDDDLNKLLVLLRNNSTTKSIRKNISQVDAILSKISPEHNSLGFAWILSFLADDVTDHNKFMDYTRVLLMKGDGKQLRLGAKKIYKICKQFKESLMLTESYITGVLPLQRAIEKLRGPKKFLMTSVHSIYLMICLKARCYRQALKVLNIPVYEVDPKSDGMRPVDFLSFQYYAGNVYCAMKKFDKALESYQMALSTPSQALSAIQIESFKKYILVCLLVHGELVRLPDQIVSNIVLRNVENLAAPYMELSRNYKKGVPTLQVVINENQEKFKKDKNYGLVNQVVVSKVRRNIQRLTNTYVVLSLKDIAESADLDGGAAEADQHVRNMIADGHINARINERDGMLKFLESGEDFATTIMLKKMDSKIKEVMILSKMLSDLNKEILLNPRYVVKTMPKEKGMGDEIKGNGRFEGNSRFEEEDRQLRMAQEASLMDQ